MKEVKTDFPLAGNAYNQSIPESTESSSHSLKVELDDIHSHVPGFLRSVKNDKSSDGISDVPRRSVIFSKSAAFCTTSNRRPVHS